MKRRVWAWLLMLCAGNSAPAQSEGIFADFSTSHGNFSVELDFVRAPQTVAGFVGLATGAGGWTDPHGNVWHKPFYDHSLFHRVVKDGHTNGIAIQGGGQPSFSVATRDQPVGVSTSVYAGQLVVDHAPGVNTNILNMPVATTNAAAVPTQYVLEGNSVETNAPMVTWTRIEASVVSSNSGIPGITNRSTAYAGFTNTSLAEQVTTNFSQVVVVLTNGSGTNLTTTHFIAVEVVSSNLVRVPTVATSFVSAGYTMLESVTNGLAHSNGVISMANAGPNTDGSQFFITATNAPFWDGGYSVFGHVTTGLDVVASIAAVPVQGTEERPVEDVALHGVAIRRVGAAAMNFNIASQGVPEAESGPMRAYASGTNLMLEFEIANQTKMLFRESADLRSWESTDWGFNTDDTVVWAAPPIPRAELGDTYFFHMSRIRYPTPVTAPASNRARKFTLWWTNVSPPVKYEVTFAANWWVQGDYVVTQGTNAPVGGKVFIFDAWTRDAYSARLYFADDSGKEYDYALGFNPGQATNRFTGRWWIGAGTPSSFSGDFTVQ